MKLKKDSWLTPNGELIPVKHQGGHDDVAEWYLKDRGIIIGDDDLSATQKLHKMGFIRICIQDDQPIIGIYGDCIDLTKPMKNTMSPPMNKTQLKIAKIICDEYNIDLHKSINDKRFW